MELQNLLQQKNIYTFEEVKKLLVSEPYRLTVKDDTDHPSLYMVTYSKNIPQYTTDENTVNESPETVNESTVEVEESPETINESTVEVEESPETVNESTGIVDESTETVNESTVEVEESPETGNGSTGIVSKNTVEVGESSGIVDEGTVEVDESTVVVDESTVEVDALVRQCRGIILEKETNRIVCYTFNRGIDINSDDLEVSFPWDTVRIEEAVDGTQIRLFYYNDEWHVSTTRCIDAKKAYWYSSRSFYDLFMEVVHTNDDFDLDSLDKSYCDAFVLKHPENRIVVGYLVPDLCHVMTRSLNIDDGYAEIDVHLEGVSYPHVYKYASPTDGNVHFSDYTALHRHLTNEVQITAEGYVLKSTNGDRTKLRYKAYRILKEIRGNTWNMFYRYIELRKGVNGELERFYTFYPEYYQSFAYYEHQIQKFIQFVHKHYRNQRIKKIIDYIPPKHIKVTLYKLHGTYLAERTPRTVQKIQEMLDALHPRQLYAIINKHYRLENE